MQTDIINIGNSKGIRLSKTILQQCNITDKVHLSVQENRIVLTSIKKKEVRKNWQAALRKMREREEDTFLIESIPYENKDWQWK